MASLFINFVDFEKAVDSLDRNIMWKLLWHYGIPIKLVNIIKCMYDGFTGQVISNGKLSDTLPIKTGVKAAYCHSSSSLSPSTGQWKCQWMVKGQDYGGTLLSNWKISILLMTWLNTKTHQPGVGGFWCDRGATPGRRGRVCIPGKQQQHRWRSW